MADDSSLPRPTPELVSPSWAEVEAWFAGHGFWRLDLKTGDLCWSDSLFEGGAVRDVDAGDKAAIFDAIHLDDRRRFDAALKEVVRRATPMTLSLRVKREDVSWRHVSVQMSPELGLDGRVGAVRGVVLDVTEIEICRVVSEDGNDIITQTDAQRRFTYVSPSVEKVTGFRPEDLVGRHVAEILGERAFAALEDAVQAIIVSPDTAPRSVEYSTRHRDGRTIWLESRLIPLVDRTTGERLSVTDVVRDITERKIAEEKLERANVLLGTLIEASPAAVLLVDDGGKVTSFNQRFAEMWNIDQSALDSGEWRPVVEQSMQLIRDPAGHEARVHEIMAAKEAHSRDEIETVDGRWIDRHTAPVRSPAGANLGRAWFYRDVTDHKRALDEAVRMARFDHLTGLANRAVLLEALDRGILQSRRRDVAFAIFYLDLDGFKDVNDTLGHAIGDELLIAVAERLRTRVRDTDVVARIGGDEFAILVSDLRGATDAALLADEIIKVLSEPYSIGENHVYTSACVGIDLFGPEATDGRTLLAHADIALYQAKSAGAGSYRFFTSAMDTEVRTRVSLGAELREAIDSQQLFLLYQPAVDLKTGRIVGVEALVRWNHPRRGVLGPDVFIPIAEQMGLIGALGRWVLWTAARQARSWLDQGLAPLRMAVNVSGLQFKAPASLESDIGAILAATGLEPGQLELELTESALVTAAEGGDVLLRLVDKGVLVAIDDFGTGYSSLEYLRRFPASRIKIAQTFVGNLGSRSGDAAIVKATIGLARELGMTVIAEGIESARQARMLAEWGCYEGQGYFFDRPLNPYALAMRIRAGGYAGFGGADAA
ncbi:MAG TPA: EAL domain-containing protein [Caulobacteraceae bacterium]|jgi:diguanylate cyclase (GGDEF)-like protein/PAS domain S-box-containing protein|nr:EAL domain-containing protein [Caulobacteraceae bacterium]